MGTQNSWPRTNRDKTGHPVPTLQLLLRARGYPVMVDGIFGPETEEAVRRFQGTRHLLVDGIAGPETWSALIITVRRGVKGDAVRAVQEEFQFRSRCGGAAECGTVDGSFGPCTEEMVWRFQAALRTDQPSVVVDGVVGPVTWRSLVSGACVAAVVQPAEK